jgi:hypothetical protein
MAHKAQLSIGKPVPAAWRQRKQAPFFPYKNHNHAKLPESPDSVQAQERSGRTLSRLGFPTEV